MDNQDFKVRIINFYKDVDKPLINNLYDNKDTKELLELSTKNDFNLLKKDKNKWVIKDKRKILKEIDTAKKKKVREYTSKISKINKTSPNLELIKNENNKIINELESIDNFKKSIDNDNKFNILENLAKENYSNNLEKKSLKTRLNRRGGGNIDDDKMINKIKIIDIKKTFSDVSHLSSDSEDFIEIFSN
jgi:hypothetical protein